MNFILEQGRFDIASNANSPSVLLRALAKDSDPLMRLLVAKNPSTPQDCLRALLRDTDPEVSAAAKRDDPR